MAFEARPRCGTSHEELLSLAGLALEVPGYGLLLLQAPLPLPQGNQGSLNACFLVARSSTRSGAPNGTSSMSAQLPPHMKVSGATKMLMRTTRIMAESAIFAFDVRKLMMAGSTAQFMQIS